MDRSDNTLMASVDARTKLAGSNRMEILLFSLGTREMFGINVFKVREVTRTPVITRSPNMPAGVEGLISLRGNVIPVVSLGGVLKLSGAPKEQGFTLISGGPDTQMGTEDDIDVWVALARKAAN